MEPIIKEIIAVEWEMFDAVQNRNGRADCQDDLKTFTIMRSSQLKAWSTDMLASYFLDLTSAQQQGRNLLTEKYARMMEHTFPAEYEAIKGELPPLTDEAREIISRIAAVQVKWLEEFARQYPHVAGNGRPIHSSEDSVYATSFETYLKGELATYSLDTLRKYDAYVQQLLREGKNMNEMILYYTSLAYGYESIEQAEQSIAKKAGQ